jgi:hypothetical protein
MLARRPGDGGTAPRTTAGAGKGRRTWGSRAARPSPSGWSSS